MFLSDHQIAKRAKEGMIDGFVGEQISSLHFPSLPDRKAVSYGLSSYGYDARIDREFLIPKFDINSNPIVDPKNNHVGDYQQFNSDTVVIPPHSFVLGKTVEYFRIPRDILALCVGKSTYARCGVNVNVTPLEPEWEGHVTIEISNMNVKPVIIYAGEGIAQFLFAWCSPFKVLIEYHNQMSIESFTELVDRFGEISNLCQTSYADKNGKYQKQTEVTPPR